MLSKYKNKRVLITGHTGFKGSWLTTWLLELGANVAGFSDGIPSDPSHFEALGIEKKIEHYIGDIRDFDSFMNACEDFKPEIIFHLAAQALVRESYKNPKETFEVNVIGTLNVMEVLRTMKSTVEAAVIITSDKAYENVEWLYGYKEDDRLGGDDPYSGSKGAAELLIKSYLKSYFNDGDLYVAIARAGNVIGGGDWAEDRIVPDSVVSWSKEKTLNIRSPYATRPWQHVLEPLSGYLNLGIELLNKNDICKNEAYNIGPSADVNKTVEELLIEMKKHWKSVSWQVNLPKDSTMKEAGLLKLTCDKINSHLDWHPTLDFSKTIEFTVNWYKAYYSKSKTDIFRLTTKQIKNYTLIAENKKIKWTIK